MIKITFQQILDQDPCVDGCARLLLNKGIIDQQTHDDWIDYEYIHMDVIVLPTEPFPLTDILGTNNFDDTLWCLRCLPEHGSLWRKYAVWCAYQVEHLMKDERSKNALRVAWDFAEGKSTLSQLNAAYAAAADAHAAVRTVAVARAAGDDADAAYTAAKAARAAARAAAAAAADAARAALAVAAADAKQEAKLRELLETEAIECPWGDNDEN